MTQNDSVKNNTPTNKNILKVGRGTVVGIVGTGVHLVLTFVTYGLITRYLTREEFGYLSLGLALLNVLSASCCLGIEKGYPSFIALNGIEVGSNAEKKLMGSLWIGVAALSVFCFFFVFSLANFLALSWGKPAFATPLKILASAIPFVSLTTLAVVFLQSHENVAGKFYKDTFTALIRVIFVFIAIWAHWSFFSILWIHTVTFLAVFLILFAYCEKKARSLIRISFSKQLVKKIITYSSPLFITGLIGAILMWFDTIVLGIYSEAAEIGVYNAGIRLSRLLQIVYLSAAFIYLPIASRLFFQKEMKELDFLYSISTKWLVLLMLPFFTFFILAPEACLTLFFGSKYLLDDYLYFQILCSGILFSSIVGPSEMSLIAFNMNDKLLKSALIAGLVTVGLSFLLIPKWSIIGAAIASSTGLIVGNCITVIYTYRATKIHPFKWAYNKVIILVFLTIMAVICVERYGGIHFTNWLIGTISLLGIPLLVLLSRSISAEDIGFIEIIERKTLKTNHFSTKLSSVLRLK